MTEESILFTNNLRAAFSDSSFSDVHFRIGNESTGIQEFDGIRALFAAQSDVLKNMLFGNMAESKQSNIVIIEDIAPKTFDWFKQYCCGLNPSVNNDNVVDVLHICDKYCIKKLYDIYLNRFLSQKITNMELLLDRLNDLSIRNLNHVIESIVNSDIIGNLNESQCQHVIFSNKFLSLAPECVVKILFESKIKLKSFVNQSTIWEIVPGYCDNVLCTDNDIKANDVDVKTNDQCLGLEDHVNVNDDELEPPKKRRKIDKSSPNGSGNENTNRNDAHELMMNNNEWVTITRKHFLQHIDFCAMKSGYYLDNVYNIQGLLSTQEKLDIFEKRLRADTASAGDDDKKRQGIILTLQLIKAPAMSLYMHYHYLCKIFTI